MNPYEFDIFILSKIQKFGLWTSRVFGIKCSDWAIGLTVCLLAMDIVYSRWVSAFLDVCWMVIVNLSLSQRRGDESSELIWSKHMAIVRLSLVALFIIVLPISKPDRLISGFMAILFLYFYSCSDGPDIKSKLREKIENFKSSMSTGKLTPIRASN